jgi:hypothetical protein
MTSRYPHEDTLSALLALGEADFRSGEWAFLQRLCEWRGGLTDRQTAWLNDIAAAHGVEPVEIGGW